MKCRRCGAELRRKGDFCPKCYKEISEEEELKNDVTPIITVKRKYKPGFHLKQRWDVILIAILTIGTCISYGHYLAAVIVTILAIALLLAYLAFEKYLTMKEKIVFYEKKVVKHSEVPIIGGIREISYKNIKDIAYYQQTLRQKRANMGDIVIYVKYTGYFGGIRMNNVENGQAVIEEIIEKVPIKFEE